MSDTLTSKTMALARQYMQSHPSFVGDSSESAIRNFARWVDEGLPIETPTLPSNPKLRTVEPFRSRDGVQAEVYFGSIGKPGIVVIGANTDKGDSAEVTLNARECQDLILWLQCALSIKVTSPDETAATPVAWRYRDTRGHWRYTGNEPKPEHAILRAEPLYARSPVEPSELRRLRDGIRALQARCCGSDDLCNGCRALLDLLNPSEKAPGRCKYKPTGTLKCALYPNCACGSENGDERHD